MPFSSLILRFFLGGTAVAGSALIGRRLGGRIGGIFAAFPAVYASAVISTVLASPTAAATVANIFKISGGALVGMAVNIPCAMATAHLVARHGWQRGLILAMGGWLVLAMAVFAGGAAVGWLQ